MKKLLVFFLILNVSFLISGNLKNDKQVIIDELSRLRKSLVNGKQKDIKNIFDFPLTDENILSFVNIYLNKNHDNLATQVSFEDFMSSYKSIFDKKFMNAFKRINLNLLLDTNIIEHELHNIRHKTDCFSFFSIELERDTIIITLKSNPSASYFDVCTEFSMSFYFIMQNQRIKFSKFEMAC